MPRFGYNIKRLNRPRPGVWPVAAERMPIRNAWIADYETAAKSFAAGTLLESIGSGVLHDELCGAGSKLPIA